MIPFVNYGLYKKKDVPNITCKKTVHIQSFYSLFCCEIEPVAQTGSRVQRLEDLESFYQPKPFFLSYVFLLSISIYIVEDRFTPRSAWYMVYGLTPSVLY
jgi:hypothetical protein